MEVRQIEPKVSKFDSFKLKIKKFFDNRGEGMLGTLFVSPYMIAFFVFIVIPVLMGIILSFTAFNLIETPKYTGFNNFIHLLTADEKFMQKVIAHTRSCLLFLLDQLVMVLLSCLLGYLLKYQEGQELY